MPWGLDRAEHQRHVGAQPHGMRGAVHLEPLVGGDLVGADDGSDLIVEHLSSGPGKRAQSGVLQSAQVALKWLLQPTRSLKHLEGSEAVDVHVGATSCTAAVTST